MPPLLFNSRDLRYRAPFGAVTRDTPVFLRICLPREWRCSAARLRIRPDQGLGEVYGMFWAGMADDTHEWWDCHYAPGRIDLYWYAFEIELPWGTRYLYRQSDATAGIDDRPGQEWQMTVYHPALTTPDWLPGGVMYQIFPDRFARSGKPKTGVPGDRILRDDWGGQPVWRPDEQGEVRNNDYFGGDLKGIEEHLDRLCELGVTCVYLNPVFEAHSNHRYDTADYEKIDPLLGDGEDFASLCRATEKRGIRVVLDGVFSHTGADSRYFDRYGRYGDEGAYRSPASPYYPWYRFDRWPDGYRAWWGFVNLPEVEENHPAYRRYILGEKGIVRRWLRAGAAGWRLDVADELPDEFLDELRRAAKAEKPDALVLGEVWEDASRKESYGHRRRYLLGDQLDSVMNYPFREAVLGFVRRGDAQGFYRIVGDIAERYPPPVLRCLMNHIGTHDTPRALTALGGEPEAGRGRTWQAEQKMTADQRRLGIRRLKLAAALQFCLPGVPCIYYGDEAGMEGYRDPFNRGCYPWGEEDAGLLDWYRRLGALRRDCPVLKEGAFLPLPGEEGTVAFSRADGTGALLCAVNRDGEPRSLFLPEEWRDLPVRLGDGFFDGDRLVLPPLSAAILIK
ncbi:MAG: glycoside hydrolase family 13 protein [Acutalibacteraceae bacterium]|jgi:cyclomaltodextrinase